MKTHEKLSITDWFYESVWTNCPSPMNNEERHSSCYLVFIDDLGIGAELVQELKEKNNRIYIVEKGNKYSYNESKHTYTLSPDSKNDYLELLKSLKDGGISIGSILHLWLLCDTETDHKVTPESINHYQKIGFLSLLYIAQEMIELQISNFINICIITNGMCSILGDEELYPEKATIQGLLKCIPQECPNIRCKNIDIDRTSRAKNISSEILLSMNDTQVAYRNNIRWVCIYEKIQIFDNFATEFLRQNGTYFITGGLGDIGLSFAEYLAQNSKANLILMGRSEFPKREKWDDWLSSHKEEDEVSKKILKIQKMELAGGRVFVVRADVSNKDQTQKAFYDACKIFGKINGVFHLAGATKKSECSYISSMRSQDLACQLLPKAKGLLIINDIIQNFDLDFVFLTSSLSVTLGGLSLGAYAGANAFMDVFAQKQNNKGGPLWFSPNWEGCSPEETKEALCRVLSNPNIPCLVMATTDLNQRIHQWIKMDSTSSGQNLYSRPELAIKYEAPRNEIEKKIEECWQEVLGIENIGINDNFYDLGGNSLSVLQLHAKINKKLEINIKIVDIFAYPTIAELTNYLASKNSNAIIHSRPSCVTTSSNTDDKRIAILGYSGVFPNSDTIEEYWENILQGKDCISHLTKSECRQYGVSEDRLNDKRYIASGGIIKDIDKFDAAFWGISPRDAALMDPQMRIFLQHAWKALEVSGYIKNKEKLSVGVFAGGGDRQYFYYNVMPKMLNKANEFKIFTLSNELFIPSRTGYLMNLQGPILNVNTACSTSLVSIIEACEKLNAAECNLAIAGGVSIFMPQKFGYVYRAGMMHSSDGYNRTFDENACGTVFSSGAGVVVLKRYSDALKDNDNIMAVIAGYSINNDGARKVSFAAPSVLGQKECILRAQKNASITSESISYVECHGTATKLGDAVEFKALSDAFEENKGGSRKSKCIIGSVKASIGHADTASGVAGVIKVCKMLQNKIIPAQIHYNKPNPQFDLSNTSFEVITKNKIWDTEYGAVRRAGVSSFGVGGTNAHLVLEEAPVVLPKESPTACPYFLLSISAKSLKSLENWKKEFVKYLMISPDIDMFNVAYTLHMTRMEFNNRYMIVCKNTSEVLSALSSSSEGALRDFSYGSNVLKSNNNSSVVFICSGGAEYRVNSGRELYLIEPVYRKEIETCCELLKTHIGIDLCTVMYGDKDKFIGEELYLHLAVFVTGYAMAKLLLGYGMQPSMFVGSGYGEYVAACLSGVLKLEEALYIIVGQEKIRRKFSGNAEILEKKLLDLFGSISFSEPKVPYVSSFTGKKVTLSEFSNSSYWCRQAGVLNLLDENKSDVFLEICPGRKEILSIFNEAGGVNHKEEGDYYFLLCALGKLWLCGVTIDWNVFYNNVAHHRLELPTYSFEKNSYWIK